MKLRFLFHLLVGVSLAACDASPGEHPPEHRAGAGGAAVEAPHARHETTPQPAPAVEGHAGHGEAPPKAGVDRNPARSGSSVTVNSDAASALGIRSVPVRVGVAALHRRAPAEVSFDPLRISPVTVQPGGQVRQLYVSRAGEVVKAGAVAARLYDPGVRAALEEVRVARDLGEPWLTAASDRAKSAGVPPEDIEAVRAGGPTPDLYAVRFPRTGVVLERSSAPGWWLEPGGLLAVVADADAVVVDVIVQPPPPMGTAVILRDPQTGETWQASVSALLPAADVAGRRVRLSTASPPPPGRPLVAEWTETTADALWVPRSALIDTGERRVVFVDLGADVYQPRNVDVGATAGDEVAIRSGLGPDERVVVAATFLLDSETQMTGGGGHGGHGG